MTSGSTRALVELSEQPGLDTTFMDDWEPTGHDQPKIWITRPLPR